MVGTYGSVRLSLVLTEQLRLTNSARVVYPPKVESRWCPSSASERRSSSESERSWGIKGAFMGSSRAHESLSGGMIKYHFGMIKYHSE